MKEVTLAAVLCVGIATTQHAEALAVRERIYVKTLSTQIGQGVRSAKAFDDGEVHGVSLALADGLTITRLRFPNPTDALAYAASEAGIGGRPTVLQARGRQILILEGDAIRDPIVAKGLLELGWSVLPGGNYPATLTGIMEGGQVAAHTGPEGVVFERIGRVLHRLVNEDPPSLTDHGGGVYTTVQALKDHESVSGLHRDSDGGSSLLAHSLETARDLVLRLEAIMGRDVALSRAFPEPPLPTTQTKGAAEGAAKKLNGLFDR